MATPSTNRASRFPPLIDRYLAHGVTAPFLAVTAATALAMLLERALRVLAGLAASGADIAYFVPVMARLAPYYVGLAIPTGFMVALVLLVARLDDNLELEAMLASGRSLGRIAAPLCAVGAIIAGGALLIGGWIEPLGYHQYHRLRAEAVNAGRVAQLQPGAIYQTGDSMMLTFDRRNARGEVENLFAWQRRADGRVLALTSRTGGVRISPSDGLIEVSLSDGRSVSARAGEAPMTLSFREMAVAHPLQLEDAAWLRGAHPRELTLGELVSADRSLSATVSTSARKAELYSRLARVVTIPLIPLLILPLAIATKRGRRGIGILLGGIILALFHHALGLARQLAMSGSLEPGVAIPGVVLAGGALVLLIFLSGRHLPSHSAIASVTKPIDAALARFRRRRGAIPGIRGRTLASYLASELARWTVLALVTVTLLVQIVEILDQGDEFVARGLTVTDVGWYALLRLPAMLQQAIPLAALAGAMVAFAGLAARSEMVAIRAAGVSQLKLLTMAVPVSLLLVFSSYVLGEFVVPRSEIAFATWWDANDPEKPREAVAGRWFRIGPEIVRARAAGPDGTRLGEVEIFRRDSAGLLVEQLRASAAVESGGRWTLQNVQRLNLAQGNGLEGRQARLSWPTPLRPGDVVSFFSERPQMSSATARRSLDKAAPARETDAAFVTRLHRALAAPFAPIVMLILALPLGFASPRRGVSWVPLLYAAGGGLLYLVVDGALSVSAQVGYLPVLLGAWGAPLIGLLSGATVLLYTER